MSDKDINNPALLTNTATPGTELMKQLRYQPESQSEPELE